MQRAKYTINAMQQKNNHTNIQFSSQAVAAANQIVQSKYQTVHFQMFIQVIRCYHISHLNQI